MPFDPPYGINSEPGNPLYYEAATFRRFLSATLAHDSSPIAARPGILYGFEGATVSGNDVTIPGGSAVITPEATSNASYLAVAPSDNVVTLDASDNTYSRIDVVSIQVRDPEIDGGVDREAIPLVTKGTPAASPIIPTPPAGSVPILRATIPPNGGTITLTDMRQYTAPLGSPIPCTTSTQPSGSSLRPGQLIYKTNTSRLANWTGSGWSNLMGDPIFLSSGSNLDTVTDTGYYIAGNDGIAASITNWPKALNTAYSGALEVIASGGGLVIQRVTEFIRATHIIWERTATGSGWSVWRPIGGAGAWDNSAISANTSEANAFGPAGGRGSGNYGARFASGQTEVSFQFNLVKAGGTGSNGNMSDISIGTLAQRWWPEVDLEVLVSQSGAQSLIGRIYQGNGEIMITHGTMGNQSWAANTTFRIQAMYVSKIV